jgi:hypothetical protein
MGPDHRYRIEYMSGREQTFAIADSSDEALVAREKRNGARRVWKAKGDTWDQIFPQWWDKPARTWRGIP